MYKTYTCNKINLETEYQHPSIWIVNFFAIIQHTLCLIVTISFSAYIRKRIGTLGTPTTNLVVQFLALALCQHNNTHAHCLFLFAVWLLVNHVTPCRRHYRLRTKAASASIAILFLKFTPPLLYSFSSNLTSRILLLQLH